MKYTSKNKPPFLILLSHPETIEGEARLVNELFASGLQSFHLRKPNWNSTQVEQLLRKIPEKHHHSIILHQHIHLVDTFHLGGFHLSRRTRNKGYEKIYRNVSFSISAHSTGEIYHLKNIYKYAFLSPVFNSISKPGYKPSLAPEEIQKQLSQQKSAVPVIALGGIHEDNISLLKNKGFQGYAVLGYIWNHFLKDRDMLSARKRFERLKRKVYDT